MSPAQAKTHFAVTIDKRLTLGAVASAGAVLILIGWNAATANSKIDTANSRITTLETKAAITGEVNERTIRIEEQLKAIRERLDRGH